MGAQEYVMKVGEAHVHHPEMGIFKMQEGVPTEVPEWALEGALLAGAVKYPPAPEHKEDE